MRNFVLTVVLPLLVTGNLWSQSTKLPARPDSGWVHDSTGTLSQSSIDRLNALCDRVAQSAGQLAVAVVPTTGGEVPRTYATRLFNNWGIGNADKDNGVLIFVAINDRKAEIVLGDGIDDEQHESRARDIMSDYMIPVFKRGQPEEAVLVAADETARQLFRMELPLENVSLAAPNRPLANQPPLVDQPPFVQPPRRRSSAVHGAMDRWGTGRCDWLGNQWFVGSTMAAFRRKNLSELQDSHESIDGAGGRSTSVGVGILGRGTEECRLRRLVLSELPACSQAAVSGMVFVVRQMSPVPNAYQVFHGINHPGGD